MNDQKTPRKAGALLALAAALTLTGCAGLRGAPPITAATPCQDKPQWTTADRAGRPVGVYVCFGAKNELLYLAKLLPPAPSAAAGAPAPTPAPAAAPASPKPAHAAKRKRRAEAFTYWQEQQRAAAEAAAKKAAEAARVKAEVAKQQAAIDRAQTAAAEAVKP